MESLPRLIVPGSPQPGFSPQPLILDPRQGMAGAARGAQPLIVSPNQLEVEDQQWRWFLSQLPYPMVRVQPLERDIGPQAPVPAWGELPVHDWKSKLYGSPANPDAAIADAADRRRGNQGVAPAAGSSLGQPQLDALYDGLATNGAPAVDPRLTTLADPSRVRNTRQVPSPAPGQLQLDALYDGLATSGAPVVDPRLTTLADPSRVRNVRQVPSPAPGQRLLMPARDLTGSPVSGGAVLVSPASPDAAIADAVDRRSSPLGNAAKIENSIAGTQTQPMAPGSGGAVLTEPDTPADPARPVSPAGATPAASALDVAVLGAEALADPVLSNVSDGGPGTSTAKGNSVIDAKLRERIEAFRRGTTAPLSPYQLPLTTGMGAGTSTAAPATVAAAGGGSPPNNPPNNPPNDPPDNPPNDPPDDGSGSRRGVRGRMRDAAARAGDTLRGVASPAFGPVDLGLGKFAGDQLDNLAASELVQGSKQATNALKGLGRGARFLAPAAAMAAPLIPVAMGAMEGAEEAGVGGAVIQGGSAALGGLAGGALAGALAGSVVPGFGTVIGGIVGGLGGLALGKGATGLAQGAVDAAQGGDTGLMGQIGRTLDPVIDTDYERQQRQITREMNSPAMKAVQLQQQRREAQARADQARALLLQSYLS